MGEPRRKSRRCGDPAGSAPPRLLPAAGGSAQLGAQRYGAGRRCGTECRGAARALRGAGRGGEAPLGRSVRSSPPSAAAWARSRSSLGSGAVLGPPPAAGHGGALLLPVWFPDPLFSLSQAPLCSSVDSTKDSDQ